MISKFFSPSNGIWLNPGLALVRILTGAFMIYHGWEIFDSIKMMEYEKWLIDLSIPAPSFMVYLGKAVELISGVLIVLGLLTRLAVIPLVLTMLFIGFVIGEGRIFMEEQHPFLFVLLAMVFFFIGPGKWSLDYVLFGKK